VLVRSGASGGVAVCGACRLARKASSPAEAGLANAMEEVRRAADKTTSDTRVFSMCNLL